MNNLNSRQGRCTLVGAGPGDPELLTLKAVKAIHAATVLFVDGDQAAALLSEWKSGSDRMPAGYTGSRHGVPTLEKLRQHVADHPARIAVQHVVGHRGDVLNEAADTLAMLGMRWARDDLTKEDVRRRAEGIATGFLEDHQRRR